MSTYILTSMFPHGFHKTAAEQLQKHITHQERFAFVASEFEQIHEKTDRYFRFFLNMFEESGIHFAAACVVDGRMTPEQAQAAVAAADVVWLAGGDTPTQFSYLQKYGLVQVLRQHPGVIIGMSAGSINLAKTAVCTLSCAHAEQKIYPALGCVNISVEPHFVRDRDVSELLELSKKYEIYGLCDDSFIICRDGTTEFYGEIYRISQGSITRIRAVDDNE